MTYPHRVTGVEEAVVEWKAQSDDLDSTIPNWECTFSCLLVTYNLESTVLLNSTIMEDATYPNQRFSPYDSYDLQGLSRQSSYSHATHPDFNHFPGVHDGALNALGQEDPCQWPFHKGNLMKCIRWLSLPWILATLVPSSFTLRFIRTGIPKRLDCSFNPEFSCRDVPNEVGQYNSIVFGPTARAMASLFLQASTCPATNNFILTETGPECGWGTQRPRFHLYCQGLMNIVTRAIPQTHGYFISPTRAALRGGMRRPATDPYPRVHGCILTNLIPHSGIHPRIPWCFQVVGGAPSIMFPMGIPQKPQCNTSMPSYSSLCEWNGGYHQAVDSSSICMNPWSNTAAAPDFTQIGHSGKASLQTTDIA
ncbi:hypothetical protein BU17DRAFT_65004 [Hysterangium stoloniferum]|nr:hypothetical protein BU17DRAFT_65004 [Hysterangium stoloniferum]